MDVVLGYLVIDHKRNALSDISTLHTQLDTSVNSLKHTIMSKNMDAMKEVDAADLVVWKLLEPLEIHKDNEGNENIINEFLATIQHSQAAIMKLNPFFPISRYFDASPRPEGYYLHFVVQVPSRVPIYENMESNILKRRKLTSSSYATTNRPPQFTFDDAIEQARAILEQNSQSLEMAANTDPKIDQSIPFFVDGLGTLHESDPDVRRRVLELFEPQIPKVMLNTPGSGKTRVLAEGLCQHWGLYFTPDINPDLGSIDLSQSFDSFQNQEFSFTETLPEPQEHRMKALRENRITARTIFLTILLGRLLVLQAFLKAGVNVSAEKLRYRWTYLQLVPSVLKSQYFGTVTDIFSDIYRVLEHHGDNRELRITNLMSSIRQDNRVSFSPFFIVLDNAHTCADKYSGAFQSDRRASQGEACSMVREIFAVWRWHATVLFSGSNLSPMQALKPSREPMGELTNNDDKIFTNTGAFVSESHQRAYITQRVTLEENMKEEVLCQAWLLLRGRYQFTAGYVYILLQNAGVELNALTLLHEYVKVLTGYSPINYGGVEITSNKLAPLSHPLIDVSRDAGLKKGFSKLAPLSKYFKALDDDNYTHLLRQVISAVIDCTLQCQPYFCSAQIDTHIVELGIGRYPTDTVWGSQIIAIDEPLVIASLLNYFQNPPEQVPHKDAIIRNLKASRAGGFTLGAIAMAVILTQQLDGTRSLRDIFDFKTESPSIGRGIARLIAIDEVLDNGEMRYTIIRDFLQHSFNIESSAEFKHQFEGSRTGVPFRFTEPRSGHESEMGFHVLDGDKIIFVTNEFKTFKDGLNLGLLIDRALKKVSTAEYYKNKNGRFPYPLRRAILKSSFNRREIPHLEVLTPLHAVPMIDNKTLENFALFHILEANSELGILD